MREGISSNVGIAEMKAGFVDLQVNGYLGINFSGPGLTVEKVEFVTQKLTEQGTIGYCPTVVSSPMEVYRENLPLIARAMDEPELGPHILGIHLEGPFISLLEGARGIHNRELIKAPDIGLYEDLQEFASGKIVLVTIAPELEEANSLIRHITKHGNVTVSLGHHMAEKSEIERAIEAGARACTHLGNGIPGMLPRHSNPIWPQLAEDSLIGMFITDGHHIPPEFIKTALRVKTPERFIVTSDASAIAGMPHGTYEVNGVEVILEESGRIRSLGNDYLAGSSANMTQCMNVLSSLGELDEDQLWEIGFTNPLRLINKGKLIFPGLPRIEFVNGRFGKAI